MKHSDASRILTLCATYDSRTIGDEDVAAWAMALHGLDPARCLTAVITHYSRNADRRAMPAHIRELARTKTDGEAYDLGQFRPCDDGSTYCRTCRLVHRPSEACTEQGCAALTSKANIRAAIDHVAKPVPKAITRDASDLPKPELPAIDAKRLESERARQLADLQAQIDQDGQEAAS